MGITDLNLSVRVFNAVCRAGIKTIPELYDRYQLDADNLTKQIGKKALSEVGDALTKHRDEVFEELRQARGQASEQTELEALGVPEVARKLLAKYDCKSVDAVIQSLHPLCRAVPSAVKNVYEALHKAGRVPFVPGDDIEDNDPIGEELSFSDLQEMRGEMIILADNEYDKPVVVLITRVTDDEVYVWGDLRHPYTIDQDELDDETKVYRIKTAQKADEKSEDISMNEETKTAVVVSADYARAVEADALVNAGYDIMNSGLYQMCIGIKRMHDGKLYKQFDFQNFEDYCKSKGFSKRQGSKYVKIAEMAENENGNHGSHFEKLGIKRNYALALFEPDDRQDFIETHDVENMTAKEIEAARAEIKRLKQENDETKNTAKQLSDELDSAKASLESKDKQFQTALEAKNKQIKEIKESGEKSLSDCKAYLNERIHELEAHITELENAPIDHDMTDADAAEEIKRLKQELEDQNLKYMMLEKSSASKAERAASAVREEYEKRIAELTESQKTEAAPDTKDVFKAYLANAADALTRLMTYLEGIRDDANMQLYVSKVDGIVEMTQTRRNAL